VCNVLSAQTKFNVTAGKVLDWLCAYLGQLLPDDILKTSLERKTDTEMKARVYFALQV
jgi:hypothetical protein